MTFTTKFKDASKNGIANCHDTAHLLGNHNDGNLTNEKKNTKPTKIAIHCQQKVQIRFAGGHPQTGCQAGRGAATRQICHPQCDFEKGTFHPNI
jgi:hypothetical protein